MLMAARKLQGIGLVLLVLILAMTLYPVSLRVASKRSELARVERDIRATRDNIRYLETELGARASMRQLERWNAESFAYSAPTAAQYLDGERQLANLGSFTGARERLAVVAPVQAATAMVVGLDAPSGDAAVQSDSETPSAAILASQIKATAAAADVVSSAKPKTNVVVPSKPTARDRYAERARMIDTLLETESPVNKTAAAVTKRVETAAAKKAASDKKNAAATTRTATARAPAAAPAAAKKTVATSARARTATPQIAAKKPEPKKVEPKKSSPRPTAVATKKADAPKAAAPKASPKKVASADKPKGNNRP